uniref:At1g61320/AtMIF1 LRR domain-containing protein n=1 Tax=Aegilops tauschii TaxID=37682 RepID=M8C512_AEGTA
MAVLARRWVRIPRKLSALDFRVSDILPPEYERTIALRQHNIPHDATLAGALDGLKARCEIDTIRSFANGITSFLEADSGHDRRVKTLRLEFFQTYNSICVDRLINAAVGTWGVEDLELPQPPSCLRRLTLGKYCALPPLHNYQTLTKLVLRDMSASTPVNMYERVFRDCTGLQVLHLTSCCCAHSTLVVDVPCSHIRELVLEECSFSVIELRDLPMLVCLACCLTDTSKILFGSIPSLMDTNLSFSLEDDTIVEARGRDEFDSFLGMSPTMANLVIRFTGQRRWIRASRPERKLPHLKRLLVADVPSNWDISWTRGLLMASTFLEVLHIHVPHSETEPDYLRGMNWYKSRNELRHHHLKELVVIGFTQRNIWLLKYVVRVCTSLQRVVLLKDGHVRYNGLWDWRMVGQQTCPWSDDEIRVRATVWATRCLRSPAPLAADFCAPAPAQLRIDLPPVPTLAEEADWAAGHAVERHDAIILHAAGLLWQGPVVPTAQPIEIYGRLRQL